jgi:hypothetical protein
MYSNQTLEISRSNQSADSDNVICDLPTITLVGNPFESIGRSEHMRTIWRALAAAFVPASLCDVYGHIPEQAVLDEMGHCQVHEVPSGIRIFHRATPQRMLQARLQYRGTRVGASALSHRLGT